MSSYNDACRSSNILIKVDSDASDEDKAAAKAKAQECLDKINSGELSFEDAVEQYSEDTGSKEKKGDVGWDKLTTFVDSYQTALEGLNKGDVSEVVESTYGYHIIKCTDYFHVDNQVDDINQVPKDIKSTSQRGEDARRPAPRTASGWSSTRRMPTSPSTPCPRRTL
ncbi:MAG: peptidylprolyl isomerase [Collinsella sp.]